ncbi:MAG TPA: dephospho-CoA kinase, partial [Opitutus sp.]|nr:dephospho-CoA kinase [Opitutus sp.]
MILGITGGIGCGKSTAAAMFERAGFRRLDSDELVRTRVLISPEVIGALRDRYGNDVIGSDGNVNRAQLAARVFPEEAELCWLEELTHPLVFGLWRS